MSYIGGVLEQQTAGLEQLRNELRYSFARHAVAVAKHPHKFEHYLARNETWLLGSQALKEGTRIRLLAGVIAGEESDEDVRIESDQDSQAASAMARSMSASDSGGPLCCTMPRSLEIGRSGKIRTTEPSMV